MSEPTERLPEVDADRINQEIKSGVDVQDLVNKGGYDRDPREIVENPAVAPQMITEPHDLRSDMIDDEG